MNKENKKFIIETYFLKEALKYKLSLNEFILLMYFDNQELSVFDVKKINKATTLDEKTILETFGKLLDMKLITLNSIKNESGKLVDKVSLDNFYNIIKEEENTKKESKNKEDFFDKFQRGYGKALSGTDFEIINAWLMDNFTEEIILKALEEANYNGVVTIRYIDKILYEWKKKGITSEEDFDMSLEDDDEEDDHKYDTVLMEFDWLNEEK